MILKLIEKIKTNNNNMLTYKFKDSNNKIFYS